MSSPPRFLSRCRKALCLFFVVQHAPRVLSLTPLPLAMDGYISSGPVRWYPLGQDVRVHDNERRRPTSTRDVRPEYSRHLLVLMVFRFLTTYVRFWLFLYSTESVDPMLGEHSCTSGAES